MGSKSLPYFLLFLLLVSESSQGIRMGEGRKPSLEKKGHGHEGLLSRGTIDAASASEIILCSHGHCAGKRRNLASFTTISTLVIPKNDQEEAVTSKTTSEAAKGGGEAGGGKENVKEGSPKPPQMDVAGIAEMDYSPARRKTPIHN